MIRQFPKLPDNVNIELINYGENDHDVWAYIVFNNDKNLVYLLSLNENLDLIYRRAIHSFYPGEAWLDDIKVWYATTPDVPGDETTYDLVYNLREAEDQLRPPSLKGYYFSKRLEINNDIIFILKPDEKGAPKEFVRFKYSEKNWSIESVQTARSTLLRVAADLLDYFQQAQAAKNGFPTSKTDKRHYIVKAGEFSTNTYWKTAEAREVNID